MRQFPKYEPVERGGTLRIQRVYESAAPEEGGAQFLVERLWPRGIRKESLRFDAWMREVAPSAELRRRRVALGQ